MYLFAEPATSRQIADLVKDSGPEIKVAVDVAHEWVAAGGELHFDCEQLLLEAGSSKDDIWGATWNSATRAATFWSVINLRPMRGLRSPDLQSPALRAEVERIVRSILEAP